MERVTVMNPKDKIDLDAFLEEARNQDFRLPKNFEASLFKDALEVQAGFKKNPGINSPKISWIEVIFQFGRRFFPLAPGIVLASTIIGVILGYYVAEDLEMITQSALGFYSDPASLEIYGNIEELLQLDVG